MFLTPAHGKLTTERIIMEILAAFLLDIVFGDPEWIPHPVVLMGRWIQWVYGWILKRPRSQQKTLGIVIAILNCGLTFCITYFLINKLPPLLSLAATLYVFYTSLAAKTLADEGEGVMMKLNSSLEEGRTQLSRIVGRDTTHLSEREIIQATVETVAENTSDGIVAPLFYGLLFGPAGTFTYKMINTMDSMVGYRNERYKEVGYGAAKLDDLANLIPARLTAFLFCVAAGSSESLKRGFRSVKEFHSAHLSPNAGWPEAAVAGILGIELGGGHFYFGEYVEKPTIGYALKEPERNDIRCTIDLMWRVTFFFVIICMAIDALY